MVKSNGHFSAKLWIVQGESLCMVKSNGHLSAKLWIVQGD